MLCAIPTSYSFSFPRRCAPSSTSSVVCSHSSTVVRRLHNDGPKLLRVGDILGFHGNIILWLSISLDVVSSRFSTSWGQGLRAYQGRAIAASEPTIGKTKQ